MTTQMESVRAPKYVLRCHTSCVTTLLQLPDSIPPALISTDEEGQIIKWDLLTRRPKIRKQLNESASAIISTQYIKPGLIAVLSKDHTLRILNTDLEETFMMHVNTLTFANFTITNSNGLLRLCCCNTTESDGLDIYIIDVENKTLKRLWKNLKFFELFNDYKEIKKQLKIDKQGMLMKVTEFDDTIFCGYESGIVIGIRLHVKFVEIVYISVLHAPEPILDIHIFGATIYTSSTQNFIGEDFFTHTGYVPCEDELIMNSSRMVGKRRSLTLSLPTKIKIPNGNIGKITVENHNLICSCWSGNTFIVDMTTKKCEKINRPKSTIQVSESSQGSFTNSNGRIKKPSNLLKIGALNKSLPDNTPNYPPPKSLISLSRGSQRRLNEFMSQKWCYIGYEDGSISLFELY